MRTAWKMLVMGVALTAWTPSAQGHGFGGGGGMGGGMLFPALLRTLDLTPEQKSQVEQIMKRHRTKLEPIFDQLHVAHGELAGKLLAPGTVNANDLSPTVQHIGQLQQQLLQEWVQAALEARAVLTPDQLAKAAKVMQRLDALRAELRSLLGPWPPGAPMD
jgi:Spy/CpxP family protein refolding chaperone